MADITTKKARSARRIQTFWTHNGKRDLRAHWKGMGRCPWEDNATFSSLRLLDAANVEDEACVMGQWESDFRADSRAKDFRWYCKQVAAGRTDFGPEKAPKRVLLTERMKVDWSPGRAQPSEEERALIARFTQARRGSRYGGVHLV